MDRLVEIFITHYRAHIADFSRPFPGVEETLKRLKREGAKLGILTNKPAELTGPLLEKLGLAEYFIAVYGAGRKSYTKPDPRIFQDVVADVLAKEGGSGPAVMIGDSITDLSTARAAAAPCILMSYGYSPVPAAELGGDMVLDEFSQLPDALKRLKL
jgi:phosphoglycolate phosphatase